MTVNHGGRLQPAYFESYLSLIMKSHNCDVDCTINTFFRGDPGHYGAISRDSFEEAVKSLRKADAPSE